MKSNKKRKIVRIAFLIAALLGVIFCKSRENIVHGHVFDEAGIISVSDAPKYE